MTFEEKFPSLRRNIMDEQCIIIWKCPKCGFYPNIDRDTCKGVCGYEKKRL